MKTKHRILLIETSGSNPFVALAEGGDIITVIQGPESGNFSVHTAIRNILSNLKLSASDLDAVAVTEGPGSYTGLRVGMAAAKGICYAVPLPFITVNSLKMMALAMINLSEGKAGPDLICPMIDARRKEVFMAVYDKELLEILPPSALIIDSPEWDAFWNGKRALIAGSGAEKLAGVPNLFEKLSLNSSDLCRALGIISRDYLIKGFISNVLIAEPFYLKPFYIQD